MAITSSLKLTLDKATGDLTLNRQPLLNGLTSGPMGPQLFDDNADHKKIYRFIVGKDSGKPQLMSEKEIDQWLKDPFAELLLKKNIFPLTANNLIEAFEKTKEEQNGLNIFTVSHIAEGGQIPWSEQTAKVNRTFRLVIALQIKNGVGTDVFVSTGIDVESDKQFLQLMSWDRTNQVFNFYQRLHSFWIWSGNSFHALDESTRNKGPFSGHINGGPIMKELKLPWQNWSSMNAIISLDILPKDHPNRNHRFLSDTKLLARGEQLEGIIRAAIGNINESRLNQIKEGTIKNFDYLLRQILNTTNFNLASSPIESKSIDDSSKAQLPLTFFLNSDAFFSDEIGLNIDAEINVLGKIYKQNLKDFDFALESDGMRFPGDTHFAFLIPEPATEDVDLLSKMIRREMISKKLAACFLMVDFCNPIFSTRRASLLQYAPKEIIVGKEGADLNEKFLKNILSSPNFNKAGSAEQEFMDYWKLDDAKWLEVFSKTISDYLKQIQTKVKTQEGYDDFVRLAESRRMLFKQTRLYEFPLTFPVTNVKLNASLEMTPNGDVRVTKQE